jgi:hypothetical protein
LLNGSDRITIFGDTSTGYIFGTGASNTYGIFADYNAGNPVWTVVNGNKSGNGTMVNTGMAINPGTTYSFLVTADPNDRSWTVNINNGMSMYQSGTLGYRAAPTSNLANTLYFGSVTHNTSGLVSYAVDGIRISPSGTTASDPQFPNAIRANFRAGSLATHVDGYLGQAGAGWLGPWKTTTSGGIFSNQVPSANPVNGGGNYLDINLGVSGTGTQGAGAVGRKFDTRVINATLPYTIAFDLRPDTALAHGNDRINVFGDLGAGYAFGLGAANTFVIQGQYNGGNPQWFVQNGNGAGTGIFVNTGMAITPGVAYRVSVDIDPATRSWTVQIDNGITQYQSGTLGFRASPSTEAGNSLYFGGIVHTSTGTLGISIDNIAITPGNTSLQKDWPSPTIVGEGAGIATHFNTSVDYASTANAPAMDILPAAGFRFARYNIPWLDVERTVGTYTWTNNVIYTPGYNAAHNAFVSRGIRPIITLAFGNTLYGPGTKLTSPTALQGFENYCRAVALQYRGTNPVFEIWNEPNLASFGGYTAAQYITLAQRARAGIIAGWREGRDTPQLKDPIILGPAVANSWAAGNPFDQMLDLGLGDIVDGLSYHPYQNRAGIAENRIPETFNPTTLKNNLNSRGLSHMPLVLTEWGWSTGAFEYEITEATQAKYLPRMILYGHHVGISINCIYCLEDAKNDNDRTVNDKHYGIFKTLGANFQKTMTPKPAVSALTALYTAIGGYAYIQRVDMGDAGTLDAAKDWCLVFWNPATGQAKAAIWTTEPGVTKTSPNLGPLLNLSSAVTASFTDAPTYIGLPGYQP